MPQIGKRRAGPAGRLLAKGPVAAVASDALLNLIDKRLRAGGRGRRKGLLGNPDSFLVTSGLGIRGRQGTEDRGIAMRRELDCLLGQPDGLLARADRVPRARWPGSRRASGGPGLIGLKPQGRAEFGRGRGILALLAQQATQVGGPSQRRSHSHGNAFSPTGNSLCRLIIAEAVARANYGMKLGKFDRIGVDRAAAGPRTGRARFSARFPGGNGEKGWECFAKAYVETGAADRSAPVVRTMPPGPQAVRAARSRAAPGRRRLPSPLPLSRRKGEGRRIALTAADREGRPVSHLPPFPYQRSVAARRRGVRRGKHATEPKNSSWRNSLGTTIL